MRRPCSIAWLCHAAGRRSLIAMTALALAGCATMMNQDAGRMAVALPPGTVVTDLGSGDSLPICTDTEGSYVDLPVRRILALRVSYDSTVQYRLLYPSSTSFSYLNLLSPGFVGFFVDQVSGMDQAAWTDTLRLWPGVPARTPDEIAERDDALRHIARPDYVHSVFDRSRTYPMLLLGGGAAITGPMTEAVIGGLNTAHVTLGVVFVPWSTVMYEHTTMQYLRVDDRRSTNVTIQSVALRIHEPEFGFAVSGRYGWASTEGILRRDDVDVTVPAPATYYAIGLGLTGQWGSLEYRRMVLVSRVPDVVPFTSWHSSICFTTHALF